MEILIFGGTAEGRELSLWLARRGWRVTLSVATAYGASLVEEPGVEVSARRLDQGEMEALMTRRPFALVVDATHPYAVEVTEHIRAACAATGLTDLRLLRPEQEEAEGWVRAASIEEAARRLQTLPGRVLVTTGSKELEPFAGLELRERCFFRMLPMVGALEHCGALGIPPSHLICMQGPFSRELNVALIRQLGIQIVVTKASGSRGGFLEKAEAAAETGCTLLVVERPRQEEGLTMDALKAYLLEVGG